MKIIPYIILSALPIFGYGQVVIKGRIRDYNGKSEQRQGSGHFIVNSNIRDDKATCEPHQHFPVVVVAHTALIFWQVAFSTGKDPSSS